MKLYVSIGKYTVSNKVVNSSCTVPGYTEPFMHFLSQSE